MKYIAYLLIVVLFPGSVWGQQFRFAQVSDTHVGGQTGEEDLRRTVLDINAQPDVAFVIFSGDLTEFGADAELSLTKNILDGLNKPWYVISGNHDTNWSESGGNSFLRIFGGDTFFFEWEGVAFLGTSSGPMMRMSPGQIPRENLVWMDSILANEVAVGQPVVFVNHYPLDEGLNNWYEALDRLQHHAVLFALCGHGHQNKVMDFEGLPGVMCRSNLRAKDSVGAYQLIDMDLDRNRARFFVRYPGLHTESVPWHELELEHASIRQVNRPDFSINQVNPQVRVNWEFQDRSDIATGMATYKHTLITANTAGELYALHLNTGEKLWSVATGGKIYGTPALWESFIVVGSSDGIIYCVDAENGQLLWQLQTPNAVLGSAAVQDGVAYIGGSDGSFRAIQVQDGALLWEFKGVKGYISSTPLLYQGLVYVGSWGNGFYAFDQHSGELRWEWSNGSPNRMFSPAACVPVGAHGRIFLVAPDRYMTALDAATGMEIFREKKDPYRVRESMGLSGDSLRVYVKTMDGELLGISSTEDNMQILWRSDLQLPYELTPSRIVEWEGLLYVPSHSGLLSVVEAMSGRVLWQYKISNAMLNPVLPLGSKRVVASTMDGKVVGISYQMN